MAGLPLDIRPRGLPIPGEVVAQSGEEIPDRFIHEVGRFELHEVPRLWTLLKADVIEHLGEHFGVGFIDREPKNRAAHRCGQCDRVNGDGSEILLCDPPGDPQCVIDESRPQLGIPL